MRARIAFAIALAVAGVSSTELPAQDSVRSVRRADLTSRTVLVSGIVYDSIAGGPLAQAEVQLVDMQEPSRILGSAVSDSNGHFTIPGVPTGRYLAGFLHPMLDSLGIATPLYQLNVAAPGPPPRLHLSIPSPGRLRDALCGPAARRDSTGVLIGVLADAGTGAPIANGSVGARWTEITVANGRLTQTSPQRAAHTGPDGWFALCDVPLATDFAVRVAHGSDTSGVVSVRIPASGLARRAFFVGGASAVAVSGPDSATRVEYRGTAHLMGTVRGADGHLLTGAHVAVVRSGLEAVTNDSGHFDLSGLPAGTQTVETRLVGYYPDERMVNLLVGQTVPVRIALSTLKSVLDTVKVTAARLYDRNQQEFENRRRSSGTGTFIDAAQIERMHSFTIVDILRRAPLLNVAAATTSYGRSTYRVRSRGVSTLIGAGGSCLPAVWVDHMPVALFDDLAELDAFVRPEEISGVEVYRAGLAPPQFHSLTGCASIVIWTHPPSPKPPTDRAK